MKLDIKLPGGGKLHFERPPVSEDAWYAFAFAGFLLFMLAAVWILR